MKFLSYMFLALITLGASSCKKCVDCTSTADYKYEWKDGKQLTVAEGEVKYNSTTYTAGETFTITQDSTLVNDGLRFEGTGSVILEAEQVCGRGATYREQLNQYDRNGWDCKKSEK